MVVIPGAMEAGPGDVLFWGALSVALFIAGMFAFPANRWLIRRGKGHVAIHETGIHGGPSPKLIGTIAAVAAAFGTVVLIAEFVGDDGDDHDAGHGALADVAPTGGRADAGTAHADTVRS